MTDRERPGPTPDTSALARYVAGECTPEESARIVAWIEASAEARALLADLEAVWRSTGDVVRPPTGDRAAAWTALMARIEAAQHRETTPVLRLESERSRSVPLRSWTRRPAVFAEGIAAAVVVAAGAALVWRSETRERGGQEYATAAGQRETITLSDGTQIMLAPATRVRVSGAFERGRRDVYLDGEALFTVVHDDHRPFAVHIRHAVVTDVGTVFGVRAYREDSAVEVAVRSGVVAIGPTRLDAGATGSVDGSGRLTVVRGDTARVLRWARGELAFAKEPARVVLSDVGRWYNLELRLADTALAERTVTGSFQDEPTTDVLNALAGALGTTYTRAGRVVVFGGGPRE
jgi:transmembrane sensor